MNYLVPALFFLVLTSLAFTAMFFAWKARSKRAAHLELSAERGEILASFPQVMYVATTPQNAPLVRVNIPSLTYRGYASLTVHTLGFSVQVRGEKPVTIPAARILGTGRARTRIDRVVEKNGLTLLRWRAADAADAQVLESAFRFLDPVEAEQFTEIIDRLRKQTAAGAATPAPVLSTLISSAQSEA